MYTTSRAAKSGDIKLHLMPAAFIVKSHGALDFVGLDAANVERYFGLEVGNQGDHGVLEP